VLFTSDTVESSEYYDDARIEAVRPATGERTVVLEGSSQARFLAPDHLLFARAGTIFAVRFDARQLKTAGTPVPLLQSVSTEVSSGAVRFATASSGRRSGSRASSGSCGASSSGWSRRRRDAGRPARGPLPAARPRADERRLVASIDAGASQDLWAVDLEQKRKSRLTFAGSPTDFVWSPDGSRVAYGVSTAESGLDMFWKLADGSAEAELLQHIDGEEFPSSFTPDGRALLFETQPPGRNSSDVARLDLASGRVEPVLSEPYAETFPVVSPDGRWLAYTSAESMDRTQIIVAALPGAHRQVADLARWRHRAQVGAGGRRPLLPGRRLPPPRVDRHPERLRGGGPRARRRRHRPRPARYTYAVARGGRVLVAPRPGPGRDPAAGEPGPRPRLPARRLTTPRR